MAPRSTTGTDKLAKTPNGHAGPSRLPAQATKSKKRAVEEVADESDDEEFEVDGADLDFGEDEDGDDEAADEESDDDEEFPELDSGSEDGEEVGDIASDADTEEEEDLDDEESGSEDGYNTSDIEAMYSSAPTSPESSGKELSVNEKLSRMVAKNTVKPDERIGSDLKISDAKEGTGKLRPSKLVPGGYLREYDDIEAGYGSESSTEDVSLAKPCAMCDHDTDGRTRTRSVTSQWSGTTIFRTSATMSLDARSSDRPRETSWTSSWRTWRTLERGRARRISCCNSRCS